MIAFAYADTGPKMTALYRALSEGMIASARAAMPNEQILLVTDATTPPFKGIDKVLRVERTMPLMVWRLKCHQVAHSLGDEILFIEPDVRFNEGVMHVFGVGFDIAITTREQEVMLENERRNTPFTLGMTFSRSAEFWRQAKLHCQTLPEQEQGWFGDMLSIAAVIESAQFNVHQLDGAVYNHVVNDPNEQPTGAKALHYKGKRKAFLFPQAEEAAP